jgi:hypothetical protein
MKESAAKPKGKPAKENNKEAVAIRFKAPLFRPVGKPVEWAFLRLPKEASAKLPSRGQCSVEGTFQGAAFQVTLEPDGEGGHWLKVERELRDASGVEVGDVIAVVCKPMAEEPEPTVPADLGKALKAAPAKTREVWADITPVARRDWIQWIVSAKKEATRQSRIAQACDKLASGKRRPCCFDRSGMYGGNLSCPVADESAMG